MIQRMLVAITEQNQTDVASCVFIIILNKNM